MIDRQHVWLGPEATSFEVPCEACLAHRSGWADTYGWALSVDSALIEGTLRADADVGFMTCRRGHRSSSAAWRSRPSGAGRVARAGTALSVVTSNAARLGAS